MLASLSVSGELFASSRVDAFDTWFGKIWIDETPSSLSLALDLDHTWLVSRQKRNFEGPGFLSAYPFACPAFLALAIDSLRVGGRALAPGRVPGQLRLTAIPAAGLFASPDLIAAAASFGWVVGRKPLPAPYGMESRHIELTVSSPDSEKLWDFAAIACLAGDPIGREMMGAERVAEVRDRQRARLGVGTIPTIDTYLSQDSTSLRRAERQRTETGSTSTARRRNLRTRFGLEVPTRIETRLLTSVPILPASGAAAATTLSRYTVDPRWLIYLPPAMTAVQSNNAAEPLEHPRLAIEYYRAHGVKRVLIEKKHTGSRAIVIVCRDDASAALRFGKGVSEYGCVYTRNGRAFFHGGDAETQFLRELTGALTAAKFWETFKTDWACFDGEIMPWSLKAGALLSETGPDLVTAGSATLTTAAQAFQAARSHELGVALKDRAGRLQRYRDELGAHLARAKAGEPTRFAPFHLLATAGHVHMWTPHRWHLDTIRSIAKHAEPVIPTFALATNLSDAGDLKRVDEWWERISDEDAEGVVVKPWFFVTHGRQGLVQPALKCRTREHLRLVYGLEYDTPRNRETLAARPAAQNINQKRRRVVRQFALSIEGLERFVAGDSEARRLECVLGILALDVPP